jgi:hypothetical protein
MATEEAMLEMQDLKLKVQRIESCVFVLVAGFLAYVLSDYFGFHSPLFVRLVLGVMGASLMLIALVVRVPGRKGLPPVPR